MITDWVAEDFGLDLRAFTPVHHGADSAADVWRAEAGGAEYAVKWSAGGSDAGVAVPARLGVAAPVRTRSGALWSVREGRRLTVTPWISDRRGIGGMTRAQWTAYGALLARMHALSGVDVPEETHTHEHVRTALHALHASIDGPFAEHWRPDVAFALLDRADALAPGLSGPAALCHGDPHLGNVLLDGDAVHLVDWDDAVRAPVERDLMFVLGAGVLAFAPVTDEQRAWFFDGYGPVDVDPVRLAYYRCVRALEDLLEPAARADAGTHETLSTYVDVISPTGLAVQAPGALRTDFISSDSMRHAPEIPAYTPTAGARREWIRTLPGTQPGDPAAAARAIVDLPHTPNPPTRLPLGSDAVARMEAKLAHVRTELDQWRAVAEGIDYQDGS